MRSRVSNRIAIGGLAALACLFAAASVARADDYPSRVVTLVVPYPPGGGVDAMARVVAQKLSDAFHQQVIVDNKAGAGGTLGTRAVAHAAPDGYTLLLGHTGTISINPSLYAHPGYDPRKDFAPVGLVASMPIALIAHPSFPAKSVADVIAMAKKQPGKLNVGTSALGTGGYMTAEHFKSEAGVDVVIIPYKGTAPLMTDLLGGHVPVAFGVLPPALGNIQAGKLRAIAVTSAKRFSLLPDVPTFAESGMPGFEAVLHYGLLAPAGTPKDIVDKLHAEVEKALATPQVKERMTAVGGEVIPGSQAMLAQLLHSEIARYDRIVREAHIKVD